MRPNDLKIIPTGLDHAVQQRPNEKKSAFFFVRREAHEVYAATGGSTKIHILPCTMFNLNLAMRTPPKNLEGVKNIGVLNSFFSVGYWDPCLLVL